ncbi:MAG: hypothetical protein HKO53_19345, partial [Gemmatimonadetes bacterium]|nr:hypothetical protein [Gemmatimonadota bacterium]
MPTTPRSFVGTAFPRLGLLGNPGDGYGGRALATLFYDFRAVVRVSEAADFRLVPNPKDGFQFDNLGEAVDSFSGGGCEDGLRLLRTAVRRFPAVVAESGCRLDASWEAASVHVGYETDIPR